MLTIEKHLENLTRENPQFEVLFSIWKLNRQHLPLAQSNIIFNFPHYSLHEKSHSDTIIRNIESFLGEERIRTLSPTDSWLILMSSYSHDLGMVIFNSTIEKNWLEDSFQEYLNKLSENSNDGDLRKAATLLINVQNRESGKVDLKIPLEIRKALILIVADYYRKSHHVRSKDLIKGLDAEYSTAAQGLNLTNLPNRFAVVLSEIAYGHGIDFYSVVDKIEYQANGFANDKMHPRFVAFMLRLGDLLDIDDKRFNIFSEKSFSNTLPKTSELHKEKHASTKHFLIDPNAIEVTVDCKSDEVYRIARQWFDWLQSEVELQSKEWVNISPKLLGGLPPLISRGMLKVLYNGAEPKQDLMNLRFQISNEKVFAMFEGAAIYDQSNFVFLRELIQNALDASKIQLWKDLVEGSFDIILRRYLLSRGGDEISLISDLISFIKFPTDLPEEVLLKYKISLKIDCAPEDPDAILFTLHDNGTGISVSNLIRMTSSVGESRSQDLEFLELKKTMPYWLLPTGAFGIGLQSLFLITDSFKIETKSDNEESKEILFLSAKNGDYCRVTSNKPKMKRGTVISFRSSSEKFKDFAEYESSRTISHDFFNDEFDNPILYNIKRYVVNEFKDVRQLEVIICGSTVKKMHCRRFKPTWGNT